MIAFGSSITQPDVYERSAKPGIEAAAEPDSVLFVIQGAGSAGGSIFRSYNLILDKAGALEDLEALVLVLQDAEIVDPDFCGKAREALRDPRVGLVGCAGTIGVRSVPLWEGSMTWEAFLHRYGEGGGGKMPASREVDTVDGLVLVLSPWVVRNLRFDESLGRRHGYDFDFCLQVREAGRRVVAQDFKVARRLSLELASNLESWVEAHMNVAEKWDGRMPGGGAATEDWKQRARRAEAEAAAARLLATSQQLQAHAGASEHDRRLKEVTESRSWRITAPIRRANARRATG